MQVHATHGAAFANLVVGYTTDLDRFTPNGDNGIHISWGDGTPVSIGDAILNCESRLFTLTGSHTYAKAGTYTIEIQINDGPSCYTLTNRAMVS